MTGSWNSGEMMKKLIWLCVLLSTFVRGQSTWTGSATLQGNFSIGQTEPVLTRMLTAALAIRPRSERQTMWLLFPKPVCTLRSALPLLSVATPGR